MPVVNLVYLLWKATFRTLRNEYIEVKPNDWAVISSDVKYIDLNQSIQNGANDCVTSHYMTFDPDLSFKNAFVKFPDTKGTVRMTTTKNLRQIAWQR